MVILYFMFYSHQFVVLMLSKSVMIKITSIIILHRIIYWCFCCQRTEAGNTETLFTNW